MPDSAFRLDPRLDQDCLSIEDWPLCRLLLMRDARYPWFILVPRIAGARDPIDLDATDHARLWAESARLSQAMRRAFSPHKLNVAALGNVVPQLHVHHIARDVGDAAWPAPVWGVGEAQVDAHDLFEHRIRALRDALPSKTP